MEELATLEARIADIRKSIAEKQEKEQAFAAKLQKEQDRMIKLNVGGQLFTTSRTTLSRFPNSMLESMVSGRFPIKGARGRLLLH